jgi:hypothetical protein
MSFGTSQTRQMVQSRDHEHVKWCKVAITNTSNGVYTYQNVHQITNPFYYRIQQKCVLGTFTHEPKVITLHPNTPSQHTQSKHRDVLTKDIPTPVKMIKFFLVGGERSVRACGASGRVARAGGRRGSGSGGVERQAQAGGERVARAAGGRAGGVAAAVASNGKHKRAVSGRREQRAGGQAAQAGGWRERAGGASGRMARAGGQAG